tara:strand:+ start:3249 stop:4289 length:1041 start_codon:yes stop_codon:yes gene_type:complete
LKKLIHIIPTLQNGGAETVLSRLVQEFSVSVEQYVITLQGAPNDFHYSEIIKYAKVIDRKSDPNTVDQTIIKNSDAPILAWMYSAILFSHKLKHRLKTQNSITWNIRHSSFRWNQLYQKSALFGFAVLSHLKKPKIIYCSFSSQQVHEKYFFSKKNRTVIQNRLAKRMKPLSLDFFPRDKPFLLYVGRYDPVKGPDRLIKIVQDVFKKNKTHSLTIAGSGWKETMIPQNIRDKVFLAGNVSNVCELYQKAEVLLFTSYTEGYPNVLVEAAVSGTPIVGFQAGDSKLILDSYDLGFSVSNQKQFMDRLNRLMKELPSQDQKLKAAQRQFKQLDFSISVNEYRAFITL